MLQWLFNIKTARKQAFGFCLCLSLSVLVGVVAIFRLAELNKVSSNIVMNSLHPVEALARFQVSTEHFRTTEYRRILGTAKDKDSAQADLDKLQSQADAGLADYSKTITDPTDQQNFKEKRFPVACHGPARLFSLR